MFQGSPLLFFNHARDVCKDEDSPESCDSTSSLVYTMPSVDEETDQVLQAIILADSFNTRFKPLTTDRPKVYASSLFSLCRLNVLASVFFLSVMPHCWTGP